MALPSENLLHDSATPDFRFESGGRVIGPIQTKGSVKSNKRAMAPGRLECDVPDCQDSAKDLTFRSQYELNRHKENQHSSADAPKYPCLASGCDRKGPKAFPRVDKMRDHVRTVHIPRNDSFRCPLPGCVGVEVPLSLFFVHKHQHYRRGWNWPMPLTHAAQRFCPLPNCKKICKSPGALQSHLKSSHSPIERVNEQTAVAEAGYDAASCDTVCPACPFTVSDHGAFASHMTEQHLVVDSGHYFAWQEACPKGSNDAGSLPWEVWSRNVPAAEPPVCPVCYYCPDTSSRDYSGRVKLTHHISMLRPSSEIYPHREAILKLWPDFGGSGSGWKAPHPVFDDLRPAEGRVVEQEE
ncbi:hypothetical protein K402DRAFT_195359 [Aulographum hederae CBS 113979]|uniref:C2H2-type domain-containing protein n=1 Tax=Aulographum hederae CBS 113979 TaxID=1176131 RepID=A0A6G1GNW7_9PEZI|nr:hypothetical protein K402DRAFT_195359 [Aulographum hederae CBS 113979]